MQAEIANKLKQINVANPTQALKTFLTVRPVGCKTKATITQDLDGFQFIMSKIPQKQFENLIKQLSEKQCELVLDYLHRYMQYISESQANLIAGQLLTLYDKIVAAHGPTIIINSITRNDTITNRIPSY